MNIHLRCITTIAATALFMLAMPIAYGGEDAGAKAKGSRSVAEMLQRRQDSQLREQLLKEGRVDEARRLDAEMARRDQESTYDTVAQLNQNLSRAARTEASTTTLGVDSCDRETLRLRQSRAARASAN